MVKDGDAKWETLQLTIKSLNILETLILRKEDLKRNGIKKLQVTATTTDLDIWLNRKLFLYLESLANPKDNPHLTPNCV